MIKVNIDSLINNDKPKTVANDLKSRMTENQLKSLTFPDFIFLFLSVCLFIYFELFTFFAPDTYVFVKYAYLDNILRQVNINSVISNNFIFDLLTLIGDKLGFTTGTEFLLLITFTSSSFFIVKYAYFLRVGRITDVFFILLASFWAFDLNAFRLNLSLFLMMYALYNNKNKYLKMALSMLVHLMPFLILLIKRLYYLPLIIALFIPFSLFVDTSRIFTYLVNPTIMFFKSLLLVIPYLICYFDMKPSEAFTYKLMKVGESFVVSGFFLLFFNSVMAARCFEISFLLSLVANLYTPFRKEKRYMLFFFAIATFISRSYSGIYSGENNFVDDFILNSSDLFK